MIVQDMKRLYSTSTNASGDGRNGHVQSDDGILDIALAAPKELGGVGGATNPEQLFAAGYAACFHSAVRLVAGRTGVDTANSAVSATVHLGVLEEGAYALAVDLKVSLPAAGSEEARALVDEAHRVCPYSNATRDNVAVTLSLV